MLTFRKLQAKDITELKKLFRSVINDFNWYSGFEKEDIIKPFKTDRFVKMLENKNYISVVGFNDKQLVSFAFGFFAGGVYTLQWIGVNKEFQKKGVATKMLQKLFGYCKTKNCHQMIISRVLENKASLGFFRSFGFQKYGTIHNHFYHKDMELMYKGL